jgi:hypothetical protein
MKIGYQEKESEINRTNRIKYNLPELKGLTLSNNQIFISLTQKADKIVFISDSGRICKMISDTADGNYELNESNNYIRIEAYFADGTEIAFNPIYKYAHTPLEGRNFSTKKSLMKTLALSSIGYLLILSWIYFTIRIRLVPKKLAERKFKLYPRLLESLFIKRV